MTGALFVVPTFLGRHANSSTRPPAPQLPRKKKMRGGIVPAALCSLGRRLVIAFVWLK